MTIKLTLVNSFKLLPKLLVLILLVMSLSNNAYSRKVTLEKTGGNSLLDTTGISLVPGYVLAPASKITFDDSIMGTVSNWTPIFNNLASIVNGDDSQNSLTGVSYKIEIDAPSATNPMIVCKQQAGLDGYFKASKNSMLFKGDTSNFINQIIVTSANASNTAYLKFADSIYYGSWLDTSQTIYYFVASGYVNGLLETYNTTSNDTADWPTGTWTLVTDSYTNNSGYIMPLDSVTPMHPWRHVSGVAIQGYAGCFIEAEYCNHMLVEKLDLDGNSEHAILGGVYGDGGIQIPYSGVYYFNCTNSMIRQCRSHSMGLDGFQVAGGLTNDVSIDTCVMEYNGRQGLSWDGGNAIKSTGSHFSNSGKAFNLYRNYLHASQPASGIDIESENSGVMTNGSFVRCVFENNTGFAVANDAGDSLAVTATHDMHFSDCTFYEPDRSGIYIKGEKFKFDSCHIYCTVTGSGQVVQDSNKTIYNKCDFEDKPYIDTNAVSHYWPDSTKLLQMDGYYRTLFQNCTFKVNDPNRELIFINSDAADKSKWTVMDNNTFIYNNEGFPIDEQSKLFGVRFKGNNVFKNILNSVNSYHVLITVDAQLEGNNYACMPNTLTFEGQVEHLIKGNGSITIPTFKVGEKMDSTQGYAQYAIKDKALLAINGDVITHIGNKSGFHISQGGSMRNFGKFRVDGQVIQHALSYGINGSINHITGTSSGLYFVDKNCNTNQTTTSPLWCNGQGYGSGATNEIYIFPWVATVDTPLCVQGGNSYTTSNVCGPLFTNIISSNSISVLYNKTVSCFGAGTAAFNFKIVGGLAPYSDTLDGVYTTDTSFASIATGNHTLKVKDSNGCVEPFNINIDTTFQYKIIKGCVAGSDAKFSTNACSQPSYTAPSGATVSYNSGTKTFSVNKAGTYTLTSGGVTLSLYIGRCDTCSIADSTAQWYPPDSSISSIFSDGVAPSSVIVLSGNIHVDTTLYIYNNDHVFLTANTQFIVDSNYAMVVNKSKLRGCNKYWDGIKADGKDRIVIVNNSSQIQDMSSGVQIMNNAFLQARNSTYLNNATNSISFKNMSDLNYNGMIWSNVFKSDTNFITFSGTSKGETGIRIFNSNYLHIGQDGDTSLGNKFSNLYTGINIFCDSNINTVINDSSNQIGIFNNKFEYIQSDSTQNIPDAYSSLKGTGVYIDYSHAPGFDAHTTVSFTKPTISSLVLFDSCYKAIVSINNNLIDSSLYLKNCNFGIMNNNLMSKDCKVYNNKIENAFIGIQFVGNYKKYKIQNNTILTNGGSTVTLSGSPNLFLNPPIAIDLKHFSNAYSSADTFIVTNNTLTLPTATGKGIANLTGSASQYIGNNAIHFSTSTTNCCVSDDPSLYGIFSSNCQGTVYDKNFVDGIHDPTLYDATYSKGLYFETSHDYKVSCNFISYTKQGLYAFGNNSTDSIGITNNKFKFNRNPIYTLDNGSAQSGTFGQIGGSTIENGNDFIYNTTDSTWLQNGLFKVWRESDTTIPDFIFTSSAFLTQSESGAPSTNKEYEVQNIAFNYADTTCPNTSFVFGTVPGDYPVDEDIVDWASVDEANAELIANQEETYIDYFETGRWLNIRYLFDLLDRDSVLRNSNFILNNFYNNYQNTNIGRLNDADAALAQVFDFKGSYDDYLQRYNDAIDANEGIAIDGLQDEYEYVVNKIAINLGVKGADSIVEADRMQLQIIANTCPFVGGTAVYKARTLWSVFNPIQQYNDRVNCLAAYGQGKMANNVNIDSLYEAKANQKGAILAQLIKSNEQQNPMPDSNSLNTLVVYPNPTNDYISIKYAHMAKGVFILFDILGNVIMRASLNGRQPSEKITLPDIANGVYSYKIILDTESFIGKLNILK